MVLETTFPAADRIVSLIVGSRIPLVAVASRRPLRLLFSLYAILWSRTCLGTILALRAMLTAGTMSAASSWLSAVAPAFSGRWILLSVSMGALTGPENYVAAVLSCAMSHPTMLFRIFLLTVGHIFIRTFDAPLAATGCHDW